VLYFNGSTFAGRPKNGNKMKNLFLILILTYCFNPSTSIAEVNAKVANKQNGQAKFVNGKKHVMHKVAKAETFYSIARQYKIEVKDLMASNKGVTVLKTGQIIQIPVPENYTELVRTGVEENANETPVAIAMPAEKPAIYHKVKKGETLSGIANKYQVPATQIIALNKLRNKQININQKLLIRKAVVANTTEDAAVDEDKSVTTSTKTKSMHTVKKGETLYGIARIYQMDAKVLSEINHLKSTQLKTGQVLQINKPDAFEATTLKTRTNETNIDAPKTAAVESAVQQVTTAPIDETTSTEVKTPTANAITVIDKTPSGKDVKQAIENGEGAWVNDADLNPNKYFALHPSAPIGTIVKVTNKMNGKYVFVKVIGKLPGTGDNENLIIKVSKAAADRMGILDQKFQCELNYAFASVGQ
jgi:LysM repeat protein